MGTATCIECGKRAQCFHHIVPKVLGGTRTVPLCNICHSKVHGLNHRLNHSDLIKKGLHKARDAGVRIGRPRSCTPDTEALVKRLFDDHQNVLKVCYLTGIPESTVRDILKRIKDEDTFKD